MGHKRWGCGRSEQTITEELLKVQWKCLENCLGSYNRLECIHFMEVFEMQSNWSTRLSKDSLDRKHLHQSHSLHCDLPMISVIATQPGGPSSLSSCGDKQSLNDLQEVLFHHVNATAFSVAPIPHPCFNHEQSLGNDAYIVLLFCTVCSWDMEEYSYFNGAHYHTMWTLQRDPLTHKRTHTHAHGFRITTCWFPWKIRAAVQDCGLATRSSESSRGQSEMLQLTAQ